MQLRQPQTEREFQLYYDLRWQVLRSPWQQPRGSEKDDLEGESFHIMAITNANAAQDTHNSDNQEFAIGVGRLHFRQPKQAQIRYMAVHPDYRGRGIGSSILEQLEQYAYAQQEEQKVEQIMLNAREVAVGFYLQHGYEVIQRSHTLYGCIPHFLMSKGKSYDH